MVGADWGVWNHDGNQENEPRTTLIGDSQSTPDETDSRSKFRFRTFCRRFANGAAGDFSPGGHARERHFIVRRTQEERSSRLSEKIGDLCNPGFCVVAIRKHAAGFLFQTDTTQCGQKISK